MLLGKWILEARYVEDSYRHGRWLEEGPYEWTPEKSTQILNAAQSLELLQAPRKWRKRVEEDGQGPFIGWTVGMVFLQRAKTPVYKR